MSRREPMPDWASTFCSLGASGSGSRTRLCGGGGSATSPLPASYSPETTWAKTSAGSFGSGRDPRRRSSASSSSSSSASASAATGRTAVSASGRGPRSRRRLRPRPPPSSAGPASPVDSDRRRLWAAAASPSAWLAVDSVAGGAASDGSAPDESWTAAPPPIGSRDGSSPTCSTAAATRRLRGGLTGATAAEVSSGAAAVSVDPSSLSPGAAALLAARLRRAGAGFSAGASDGIGASGLSTSSVMLGVPWSARYRGLAGSDR